MLLGKEVLERTFRRWRNTPIQLPGIARLSEVVAADRKLTQMSAIPAQFLSKRAQGAQREMMSKSRQISFNEKLSSYEIAEQVTFCFLINMFEGFDVLVIELAAINPGCQPALSTSP